MLLKNTCALVMMLFLSSSCHLLSDQFTVHIVHDQSNAYSLNQDFIPAAGAHIRISISYQYQEIADAAVETVYTQDIQGVTMLPYDYQIRLSENPKLKNSGHYWISVTVFNGPGDTLCVGDLMSEYSTEIYPGSQGSCEVKVFGMEDCSSTSAGGYCTTTYR